MSSQEYSERRELKCWLHPSRDSALAVFAPCLLKVSLVSSSRPPSPDQLSSSHPSNTPVISVDSSMAPVADFDYPPEFSSCLDNSAAKHKLLVKPRNQRSSKMRRLSSVMVLPFHLQPLAPLRKHQGPITCHRSWGCLFNIN